MKRIIGIVVVVAVGITMSGCTMINRMSKNIQVNTTGLHRKVTVYSDTGEVIKEYEGKDMTISDGDGGTLTIDFEGKRVTICNADIIVEEVGTIKE